MKGYVDGPFGQIHFERGDNIGDQPIVLLHQTPLSGDMFAAATGILADKGLNPIALDTPGYGASDPPPHSPQISDYADAIAAAICALHDGPVALLGHHTGASIAANIAARYPDLVAKLVLNGVALLSADELAFFNGFKFGPITPKADGSHLIAAWDQRLAASPGWTDLAAMHRHVVSQLRVGHVYHYGFEAAFRQNLRSDLAAIKCPTLILTNDGDDLFAASNRAHQLRPDFAYHALPGGTHDIVDEQPQNWVAAVADFIL